MRRVQARDAQRLRLYKAETAAEHRLLREERAGRPDGKAVPPRNPRLADDEVQSFVNGVTAELGIAPVTAILVPDRKTATYELTKRQIVLPPWARCPLVILHELAHFCVDPIFPGHGAEYAAAELSLLEQFMPEPVGRYFREAFLDEGIEFEPSAKQGLRFLSYAKRTGKTDPVYVITADGVRYEGVLLEYDRRAGRAVVGEVTLTELESVRYASWV